MKTNTLLTLAAAATLLSCTGKMRQPELATYSRPKLQAGSTTSHAGERKIVMYVEKALLYDKYTLADIYPYKDTVRRFQWEKIEAGLHIVDSIQRRKSTWGIIQNKSNRNGEAPAARNWSIDSYNRMQDAFGVEKYQSAPLYSPGDSIPGRYGLDGSLVKVLAYENDSADMRIAPVHIGGEWIVPKRYVRVIDIDTLAFDHVIFVDRTNQNIATLEKVDYKWLVRSMNPATTGVHRPPYMQETPLGIFVIQDRTLKMFYYADGTTEIEGFAPYASRFCKGAYIHGVPIKNPEATDFYEYSYSLGTTPRSHMCVRNATSHAQFVFNWAPVQQSLVFIIE